MNEFDESECVDREQGDCRGDVREYRSRSGATVSKRCAGHQDAYESRMDQVYAGVNERYPGWQTPGSVPPAWFDPGNAGETWDDDF